MQISNTHFVIEDLNVIFIVKKCFILHDDISVVRGGITGKNSYS